MRIFILFSYLTGPGAYDEHEPRCRLTYSMPVSFQAKADRWAYKKSNTADDPAPNYYTVIPNRPQPTKKGQFMFRSVVPRLKSFDKEVSLLYLVMICLQ